MRRLDTYPAKPFVKWVGGKTQLLKDIKKSLPHDLSKKEGVTYVEPFVGGGAVLFWILQEYPNITRAVINDINAELICTYQVVKSDVENLIIELSKLQTEYLSLKESTRKEYFLYQRNRFNERQCSNIETAALFIFLNRTCFNGLYRVNSKGHFNVPHGKYTNPKICDKETLRADSSILQRVEILCGDFSQTEQYAGPDTIFYFNPPYKPITETSSFTSYYKDEFNDDEQIRFRDFCSHIFTQNSHVIPKRNYLFYTDEGYCEDCVGNIVENLQILGIVYGFQKSDAFTTLIKENPWISIGGYDFSHIRCRKLR